MVPKEFQEAIDKILSGDRSMSSSKEEAKRSLIACGIFNEDGTIADAYKGLFIKNERPKKN